MKLVDIVGEVEKEMEPLKDENLDEIADKLVDLIVKTSEYDKIYVYGAGRSGFIGKSFVMRMVQLGINSYSIGESSAPLMNEDDIIIIISGSAKTKIIQEIRDVSFRIGLEIVLITTKSDNNIPKVDFIISIGGKSKTTDTQQYLPLGSYFEINSFLFLESIVAKLMSKYPELKNNIEKFGKHYKKDNVIVI